MSEEYHKCSKEKGFCSTISKVMEDMNHRGKGIIPLMILTNSLLDETQVSLNKIKPTGLVYKTSASDRGIMFNHCPFCGEKIDWWRR